MAESVSNKLSPEGVQKITCFKRSIIMKKILLDFIIDNYAFYDKLFRWVHRIVAVSTIAVATINKIVYTDNSTSIPFIILAGITAAMIKIKEDLRFEKIREKAKEQNVKYKQLYERIDRELLKPENKQQSEEDLLYWICRELNSLEMSDPDLTHNEMKKFLKYCHSEGIKYDTNTDLLNNLKVTDDIKHTQQTPDNSIPTINHIINLGRVRSLSEEREHENYKHTMRTINTKDDLLWARERLDALMTHTPIDQAH